MDNIFYYICVPFGFLMKCCWQLVSNYGLAIVLFTLVSKIVLLPVSVWIQKNSITMVKIQPEINFLKAKFYGDTEAIAEGQAKLFKERKYRPMLSLIPLIIQIVLLMAVVEIIYHPLSYLFAVPDDTIRALFDYLGSDVTSNQLPIVEAIKNGTIQASTSIPGVSGDALAEIVSSVRDFDLSFCGFQLSVIPTEVWGIYLLIPIAAGLSSFVLCFTQNLANVIQHEQGKLSKYGLMILSVAISLYLGCFVPAGIALYWIASNLFSVAQMYILNAAINPKKYVDYEALERSRKQLADIEALETPQKKDANYRKNKKREKKDYKQFFRVVNKHVVFYSEKSGFYKYFEALIEELLERSNLTIHYVTNDPDDQIFRIAQQQPRIRPYYIGLKKLIPLMMLMECDIVVMTTPDFDKYYLKRSRIRKEIEYIYLPHDMMSVHMGFKEGALDAFDTIFCSGEHVVNEVRATERVYGLPEKKLVPFGYPLADRLVEAGKEERSRHVTGKRKKILIAPSWQEDNLLDSCIDTLIEQLYGEAYQLIVRPHPEYAKRFSARLQSLVEKYKDKSSEGLVFELDFSKNDSITTSDLLITDWSGIAPEFCFATGRPALFVNTKLKCLNPNWENLGLTPVEISLRDELGRSVEKQDLNKTAEIVREMLENTARYHDRIDARFETLIYNHGKAGAEGAKYILQSLMEKRNQNVDKKTGETP